MSWPGSTPATPSPSRAHTTLGTSPIVNFGSDDAEAALRPAPGVGQVLGGFGLTEPGAGSDAGGTQTTADAGGRRLGAEREQDLHHPRRRGRGVRGHRARPTRRKGTKGISSFIVTKPTIDIERARGRRRPRRGSLPAIQGRPRGEEGRQDGVARQRYRELIFEDATSPTENVLGEEGQGFVNFMKTLDAGRIGIAALSLGIAEGAYEQALALRRRAQAVRQADRRASRGSSSSWPTWPPRSKPRGTWSTTPRG